MKALLIGTNLAACAMWSAVAIVDHGNAATAAAVLAGIHGGIVVGALFE
jgi:hypothetical protein